MKFHLTTATAFAAGILASPLTQRVTVPVYGSSNPVIDSTCPVPSSAQPLGGAYPFASFLGSIITPALRLLLGSQTVENLDAVADQLCISAQQDPTAGDGICQDTFGAVRDFVDAKTPLTQSKEFGCLLDLLCVAHSGPQIEGTCNQLFAGAANRMVGVENLECY
ncbi:hypothetical protein BJ170DRAFT_688390 [Xylariales sp. AK1849]|nr:hypothetical protein BJ170DRAFT_688390 [Xylariales sp. AK1849]